MKIRTRLTLWYFVVTLLIFVIFSVGIFFGMRQILYDTLDEDLNRFADVIEKSFNPMIGQFEELIWKFDSYKRYQELYIIVYNAAGRPIFASPLTQYFNLEIPFAKGGKQVGYTINSGILRNIPILVPDERKSITFRAISRRMTFSGSTIGWIQAALPITNIEQELDYLLKAILFGNALGVFLIVVGGYFLTRQLLHPISIITDKANHISHSNLDERIVVSNTQDELGQLTNTLNDLLDRLQKAFISQKQFIADAAHELKTPLAVLRSQWDNELNNPQHNEEYQAKLGQNIETIARLNQLISNLLLLSKTERGGEELHKSDISIKSLLTDVTDDIILLAKQKKQNIEFNIENDILIKGDRDQLYRVFFNVLDNAVKYTPDQGKICINVTQKSEQLIISIEDDGPGLQNMDREKIFERFYRVDKARSRETGGAGLGLPISRQIIEAHGGKIFAESIKEKGSRFIIQLPLN